MKRFLNREQIAGYFLLGSGLLVVTVLIQTAVVEPAKVKFVALSPSYYPRIIALTMCLLGLIIVVRTFVRPPVTLDQKASSDDLPVKQIIARLVIVSLILGLYHFSLNTLGFVVSSSIVLMALMWLANERKWSTLLGVALILPVCLHLFFQNIAGIPIPAGVLEPILQGI